MKSKKKSKAAQKKSTPAAGQPLKQDSPGLTRFSTTKKAVGVLALATLGLGYLARRRRRSQADGPRLPDAEDAE